MSGTVWVVQENPKIDYAPAESYGEVKFMTADEFRPMAGSIRNQYLLDDIKRSLSDFDPDKDWLVFTGNPVVIGFAFHLVAEKNGRVPYLQWDRMRNEYRPFTFNVAEQRV